MKKVKFKLKESYYSSPTPKIMRKLGDGLLASGAVIAISGIAGLDTLKQYFTLVEVKWMLGISIGATVTGKFLTNFFKEDLTK